MEPSERDPRDLLPLSPPVFHVLLALGDNELHGYAIMQEFERMTGGKEALLPGTLYASIARMLEAGLVEEASGEIERGRDDRRRRYYRLTPFGQEVARAESKRMQGLLDVARQQSLLPGGAR
ncbi:MAG: helix-turn-helix transcriptional regulator [Gemmatimonadetes bacterium]|nr:helix-turn-helix transcriptional regulator [Gemmatimonadota bacterium]